MFKEDRFENGEMSANNPEAQKPSVPLEQRFTEDELRERYESGYRDEKARQLRGERGSIKEKHDIEVAKQKEVVAIQAKLYTSDKEYEASKIDTLIEPKCIFWDEYKKHDKASILAEIIRTGIKII